MVLSPMTTWVIRTYSIVRMTPWVIQATVLIPGVLFQWGIHKGIHPK